MPAYKNFHMTPDEFRLYGRMVIDWIADYYQEIEKYPVLSRVEPGEIRAGLPPGPPQEGESFETILGDIESLIMPGITHWQSPNFFAFFPANTSGPSILADLLSSGLGVQGMSWITSPACTELETHVLDWLAGMLGLPERFMSHTDGGGVIQDTASTATLTALLAARERTTNFSSNLQGCDGKLVAYASTQTHSSIEKAVKIAGLGSNNLRLIDVDQDFALRPGALEEQIKTDRANGLGPVSCVQRSARHPQMQSIQCGKLVKSASGKASGCTLTQPCLALPLYARNTAISWMVLSWPIHSALTLTSGCSQISTAIVFMLPIDLP